MFVTVLLTAEGHRQTTFRYLESITFIIPVLITSCCFGRSAHQLVEQSHYFRIGEQRRRFIYSQEIIEAVKECGWLGVPRRETCFYVSLWLELKQSRINQRTVLHSGDNGRSPQCN